MCKRNLFRRRSYISYSFYAHFYADSNTLKSTQSRRNAYQIYVVCTTQSTFIFIIRILTLLILTHNINMLFKKIFNDAESCIVKFYHYGGKFLLLFSTVKHIRNRNQFSDFCLDNFVHAACFHNDLLTNYLQIREDYLE